MKVTVFSKDNLMNESTIHKMFELLDTNMSKIAPLNLPKDAVFQEWLDSFYKGLREGTKHLVIMDRLCLKGYLSFTLREDKLIVHFNEIQISPFSQRDGVTVRKLLYGFLHEIKNYPAWTIRTYVNNLNSVSNKLAARIGFQLVEQTDRGRKYSVPVENMLDNMSYLFNRNL